MAQPTLGRKKCHHPLISETMASSVGSWHYVIDASFPLELAGQAHAYMEQNNNEGKIILEIR